MNGSKNSKVAKRAGRKLRALREGRGLSLADVEARTGMDRSNIARYERGEGATSLDRYEDLAKFYGLDLGRLFSPDKLPASASA